ncbi:MAG: hypothetical protein ABIQ18_42620 [Umezawaea sp.]
MTDLDALRRAMHAEQSGTVDVAAVMTTGRRIRTRRRLVRGGGIVGGTAALLVGVFALGQSGVGTTPQPTIMITAAKPADPSSTPVGNVIMTGFADEVLYFVGGYHPAKPRVEDGATAAPSPDDTSGTGYGLTLGTTGVGRVIPSQTTDAAGHWTGFHSLTTRPSGAIRLYGYYEGPVKRIVLELDDEELATARTAAWSADTNIVVFWFAPQDIPADKVLDTYRLVAYDDHGQVMPF